MKITDRITLIQQALHSGTTVRSAEQQATLDSELHFLRHLSTKAPDADIPDIYQSGRVWGIDGLEGVYSAEHEARLGALLCAATKAGVEIDGMSSAPATIAPSALAQRLLDMAATGDGARNAQMLLAAADQLNCLQHIFNELDGQEFSPDNLDNIVGYLSAAGLEVRDSDDFSYDDDEGPSI